MSLLTITSDTSAGFIHLAARLTLVLAGAWICHALLRNSNPHWRILVWRISLVGLLFVALLSWRAPLYSLALLPSSPTASTAIDAEQKTSMPLRESSLARQDISDGVDLSHPSVAKYGEQQTHLTTGAPAKIESAQRNKVTGITTDTQSTLAAAEDTRFQGMFVGIAFLWSCGLTWGLVQMGVGARRVRRICRNAEEIPTWVEVLASRLSPDAKNLRSVQVKRTDKLATPCSVGIFQQTILVPAALCTDTRKEELQAALAHEFAHFHGNDLRWNFGLHIMTLLLWFHPLAWRVRVAHVDACDERCDADAAGLLPDPLDYARALARIALNASGSVSPDALMMARSSSIGDRIRILEKGLGKVPLRRWQSGTATSVASASLLVVALVGVGRSQADAEQVTGESTIEAAEIAEVDRPGNPKEIEGPKAAVDLYGDSLERGAIARLGTSRYRHPGWHKRIAFLPDSKTFVVGTSENTVRFWDSPTGKMVHEIDLGDDRLVAFRLSPNGRVLATLSHPQNMDRENRIYQMRLIVWDTDSRSEIHQLEWEDQMRRAPTTLALSPSGKVVAVATSDGTIRLLNLQTGEEIRKHKATEGDIDSIEFSPNGKLIAMASRHGVKLWNFESDDEPMKLDGLPRGGQVVRFSPSGTILAAASDGDTAARLYNVESGKLLRQLRGNSKSYYREGFCFSRDGQQIFIPANAANSVEIFDVNSGELERSLDTGGIAPRGVAISSDSRYLACIGSRTAILVWNLQTDERISEQFVGHQEPPYDMIFTPDGQQVVTGCLDASIRIWDAATGRQTKRLNHDRWVAGLALSNDSEWIASCGLDETVRLWEFSTGKEKYRFPGHGRQGGNGTTEVAFSPDGERFYTFGMDFFLRIYSVKTGRILAEHAIRPSGIPIEETEDGTLKLAGGDPYGGYGGGGMEGLSMLVDQVLLSPDATLLLLGVRSKGTIYLFDTNSGKEIDVIKSENRLQKLAVSPNGNMLVTVESVPRDKPDPGEQPIRAFSLRVRNLLTKELVHEHTLQGSFAGQMALSDDGALIALSQIDWTPRAKQWIDVFDSKSLKRVARLEESPHAVRCVRFSPDGTQLATSHKDSTVAIWDLNAFGVDGYSE